MLEIALSVELGSPADTVWRVIGNFNGLPDWHPWVESSVLEPAAGGIGVASPTSAARRAAES